jgi:tRNA-dihydrouridine synthase B
MIKETGCDGVMLARGLIENPFLTSEILSAFKEIPYNKPLLEERIELLLKHCETIIEIMGEERGILEFRKYFHGYLKGYPEVKRLRQEINYITTFDSLYGAVKEYHSRRKKETL